MEDNFANKLSAAVQKETIEDYMKNHEEGLRRIEELKAIANKLKVNTIADYKAGMTIKGILSSLYCYAFNNDKNWKEVGNIENIVGNKLYKFAKNYQKIRDRRIRAIAKYLITNWRHYYAREDIDKMIKELLSKNRLFRDKNGNYLVTGLHYAVGDNTSTYDRNGKLYRNYVKVCGIQAFYIKNRYKDYIEHYLKDIKIPELNEDIYEKTGTGDGKYLARVYLTKEEHYIIRKNFIK